MQNTDCFQVQYHVHSALSSVMHHHPAAPRAWPCFAVGTTLSPEERFKLLSERLSASPGAPAAWRPPPPLLPPQPVLPPQPGATTAGTSPAALPLAASAPTASQLAGLQLALASLQGSPAALQAVLMTNPDLLPHAIATAAARLPDPMASTPPTAALRSPPTSPATPATTVLRLLQGLAGSTPASPASPTSAMLRLLQFSSSTPPHSPPTSPIFPPRSNTSPAVRLGQKKSAPEPTADDPHVNATGRGNKSSFVTTSVGTKRQSMHSLVTEAERALFWRLFNTGAHTSRGKLNLQSITRVRFACALCFGPYACWAQCTLAGIQRGSHQRCS
jgi:hypothetical protein